MEKKKILIFDDDTATLEVLSIIGLELGYLVETRESADNILSDVSLFLPDLIMMDVHIPMIGGIEATRLIKTHNTFHNIPVTFITAKNDAKSLSSKAHVEGYLSKPFDIDELELLIKKLI